MAGLLNLPPKKGEIYWVDFSLGGNSGSEQGGLRPAVIISCDELNNAMPVVTVAAVTSKIKNFGNEVSLYLPEGEPLPKASSVLAFQVRTIDRVRLIRTAGNLTPEQLAELDRVLKRAWGLT